MAEQNNNLFNRLKRLFGSSVVIRKTSDNRLVVKDVDFTQMGLTTNFIDRYTRLSPVTGWGTKYSAQQNAKNSYEIARNELFRDFESMDSDSIISSALDIYSDESNITGIDGSILTIKTNNAKLHKILHNLFYDILNIEFNLWSWLRNLTKYGDFFLLLDIADKYGIVNVKPLSPYDVIRLEDHDPSDPKLVQYEITGASDRNIGPKSERKLYENYEIAHFRLLSDSNFLPYGKSMLDGARRIWQQLTLMEDSMLIHRIMRAPEKRIFKIDIGNIPPNEVDNYMEKIINRMKKIPVIDQTTGELNLRYNVESVLEDYFMPVRGGDSGTEIDTLPGLSNDNAIDDIEYLRNKMMAALKIPKAFLGYDENLGSKCLHPDTEIPLLNNTTKTIKEIADEFANNGDPNWWVYSYDRENNSIIPAKIKLAEQTRKNAKLIRVYLDNNTYVDCTPDHNFVLRGGEKKQAQDLILDDSLQAVYRRAKRMSNNTNHYEQVYQPSIDKWIYTHKMIDNYFNGSIEKNSGMGEAALQSNLNRLNIDEHYWKNNILASTYNHKVVNIEWLDERIDTYNLEVDDENHNYLISNGIIIKNSTLAAEDVRFARTIERLQKIVVAELEKIAIVHLYAQGFTDAELLSFDLQLTNPSMIHEQEKLELLNQQVDIAQNAIENKLFSQNWIYDNIFDLNEHQKRELMKEIVIDSKQKFRYTQIEDEGNDPFETGERVDDDDDNSSSSLKGDWGGSEKDPQYTHHDFGNARAKDKKDATKYEREHYGKREFKGGSPLYPGKGSTIVKTEGLLDQLKKKFKNQEKKGGLLSEDLLFVEEEA